MSPVARGAQGSCRGGDLRWRPGNRNRRLGKRRRVCRKAFQKSESADDQRHQAVCRPCRDRRVRAPSSRSVASHCMACELSKVSSVQVGSTPSSHCRTWGSCKKSSTTMPQLAIPNCRETGGFGRSHSLSFDQRLRPDTLRTAMATAFFCPTSTTSFLPRVTPV